MEHITYTQLQEYTDQILGPERVTAVEAHLRTCRQCANRLLRFRGLEAALRNLPLEKAPEGLTSGVMNALAIRRVRGLGKQLLLNLLPLTLAAVVVVALAGFFAKPDSPPPAAAQGKQGAQTFDQQVQEVFSSGTAVVLDWTMTVVRLSAGLPFIKVILWAAISFVVLALFDEFVFLPMMKKRT